MEPIDPTTLSSYALAIKKALDHLGVNSAEVFARAGMERELTNSPLDRINASEITRIFAEAVKATNNESVGLLIAEFIFPSTFHALGYGMLSSSTLLDCFIRLQKYMPLVSYSGKIIYSLDDTKVTLETKVLEPNISIYTVDTWIGCLLSMIRFVYKTDYAPIKVELARPAPDNLETFEQFFKCPVSFGCTGNIITLNQQDCQQPLIGANPELAMQNDKMVMAYMSKLEQHDIVAQVKKHIINNLSSDKCDKTTIATLINMSPSTLQHKLKLHNTSFSELVDEQRREFSLSYIKQKQFSITQICYMVGFHDSSSFTRAFKRWTGQSPKAYITTL